MRFTWITAVKDLRRLRHDPVVLLVWLGIPVFVVLILSLVFGGQGAKPHGRLLVADEDQSFASSMLAGAFTHGELSQMVTVENVNQAEGRRRIEKGDGSALLVIPKGFGRAFLRGEPFAVQLVTNPAQQILPNIIEQTLGMTLEAGFYAQLLLGDQLKPLANAGSSSFSQQTFLDASAAISRLITRVRPYLDPPRIDLETQVVAQKSPFETNFAAVFLPGTIFMTVLFLSLGLSSDLWRERLHGTLRRAAAMPGTLASFLAGKMLSVMLVLGGIGAAGLFFAHWLLKVEVRSFAFALLWIVFSGAALYLLAVLLQVTAPTQRAANVVLNLVMLPLAILGGSFFPFEVMPARLASIGRLTPNGFAVVQLKGILAGSIEATRLMAGFAGAGAVAVLVFWLAVRRLRRGFLL